MKSHVLFFADPFMKIILWPLSIGLFISCLAVKVSAESPQITSSKSQLSGLPTNVVEVLAEHHRPNEEGAMGRNRNGYFHVRFQLGLHYQAYLAVIKQDTAALAAFTNALEYAMAHQREDGSFKLIKPKQIAVSKKVTEAEQASGVAFFVASAGSGLITLKQSTWFQQTKQTAPWRIKITNLTKRLQRTERYLLDHKNELQKIDSKAPNRLLFDAVAFYTLGVLLGSTESLTEAGVFKKMALRQMHKDGYFIENGGYDSSYNGVAAALALRLSVWDSDFELRKRALQSLNWQASRVTKDGEILTDGNTRVTADGETFLGRQKDVDVFHSLEALALASLLTNDQGHSEMANRIYTYYSNRR